MANKKPRLTREYVGPGQALVVKDKHVLILDGHLLLSGMSKELPASRHIIVQSQPRRIDGINLVRVSLNDRDQPCSEHECFYCDVLKDCELL